MAIILSIETSTNAGSVAVHHEDKFLAQVEMHHSNAHSYHLNHAIDFALKLSDVTINQLEAIALSKGPGSYTGLRIGTSTAKGLCCALNIPLISVNTLRAMAKSVAPYFDANHLLCPMIDARRMEVYTALYNITLSNIFPTEARILAEDTYGQELQNSSVVFFGNGAAKFESLTHSKNAIFLKDISPSAKFIGELAISKYQKNQFEDLAYFEPYYLKEFMATKPKTQI